MEPHKRKRRRFQFRLRTLMVVVTLLAVPLGYVGWQAKIVRERKAWRANSQFCEPENLWPDSEGTSSISWLRRLLGDKESLGFITDDNVTDSDLEECRAAFPEAVVRRDRDQPALSEGIVYHFRNGKLTVELRTIEQTSMSSNSPFGIPDQTLLKYEPPPPGR